MVLKSLLKSLLSVAVLLSHSGARGDCPRLPVFTPSVLVVKFGDPAFATCSISDGADIRLEEPLSSSSKRGAEMVWNVPRLTVWSVRPICYVFDSSCRDYLDVTVYQPPDRVALSFKGPSGPAVEGQPCSLQCEVENVAPAQNMSVAFYRGHMELGVRSSRTTKKTPVTESMSLNYTVSKEDHGALFWCQARLELGPGGPQPPPVVRSQNVTANVLYAPYGDAEPQQLSVFQGQAAELHCSSEGNPDPHYSWSVPSDPHPRFSGSVFIIQSASSEHEGLYTCNASNSVGSLRRSFTLTVHDLPVTTVAPVMTSAPVVSVMTAAPVTTSVPVVTVTTVAPVMTSAPVVSVTTAAPEVTLTTTNHSTERWSLQRLSVGISLCLCLYGHFTEI